ncbi:MAG TPA: phage tail protein, partial [Bryobacteraceae bacterium]|nr:phage tail protein [Bryobacteraceae bacterium]
MLSLRSIDGSLGGLALPRGMAFDREMTLYLLGPQGAWVKRWDAETRSFAKLPEVGGEGDEPRRLRNAESLAIANDWLYIADAGNHRVQIFDLRTLVLIDLLFIPQWLPVDLAAHKGAVYILDKAMARVFRHTQDGRMARVLERPDRAGKWPRVITDQQGRLYLLNDSDPDNVVLEQGDPGAPPIPDPGFVRDLFDQPAIRMDERKRFFFPESVARVCRHAPAAPPDCRPRPQAPSIVQTARGRWLTYVARRAERRVDAYVSGARLRHCWGAGMDWQPADVAACGDTAFILDERNQIVYRHHGGSEDLKALDLGDTSSRHWSRVACDRGTLYLYMPGAAMVQVFSCAGAPQGERCYADLAALFEAQRPPEPAPAAGGYFDSTGQPVQVDLSDANASPLYRASGSWQSKPLDSQIYRCQWHRIELSLSEFPPGSRVSIATCATETADDVYDPAKARFIDAATLVAPLHQPQCPGPVSLDCLVQSGLGQFLAVRMTLEGDGFSTPAVDFAKIHYPRDSYLQYLPATYSTDDESRVFLERFLSIFQTEWDELEDTIGESERYFDPDAVPEGPFMDYLAQQWLAVPLEGDWSGEQKRRLLSAIPKIYPHRGQLGGLRDFVSVYLANIAGLETAEVRSMDFPVIVEGFREREYLFASAPDTSTLGPGAAPLWSASVKRRLQLGVYS